MDVIPTELSSLLPSSHESIVCGDLSHEQVCIIQLVNSFLKKYEPSGPNDVAEKAALDLFIESNTRCSTWVDDQSSYHYDTMLRAREKLHQRFYSGELQRPRVSLANAMKNVCPGPGSSIGTKLTDFVGKVFASELTAYDPALWHFYKDCIPTSWKLAESLRERKFGGCKRVLGSRLTFAKKNYDIARVINTEASLEMLFQKGIARDLEGMLKDFFNICLSTQPVLNRWLARLGSMYGDFATIDLKSASDSISVAFMQWFLPPALFQTLNSVRAKSIELPDGEMLDLEMFSTMGNGFTFPLQTLVFASIVEAAYEELGLPTHNSANTPAFSVFGDDIICVKHAFDKVTALLGWCGFTVNTNKSFNSGSFRESCGGDYFKGRDVRGVYLRKLNHETHYYSIFNRLTRWSAKNGISLDPILSRIFGYCHHKWYVPFDAGDGDGLKVPMSVARPTTRDGVSFYTHYAVKARKLSTRNYEDNPQGVLIGALGGFIDGTGQLNSALCNGGALVFHSAFKPMPEDTAVGSFNVRQRPDGPPDVKRERSFTPSWDWIPHKGLTTLDYLLSLPLKAMDG